VFSGFPFFLHAVPELVEVVDFVLIHSAFRASLLGRMAEAIASSNVPIVAAAKKMHNKTCHPTTMSGGV
jgi:hypothetical protein